MSLTALRFAQTPLFAGNSQIEVVVSSGIPLALARDSNFLRVVLYVELDQLLCNRS
jgi:hypothetical protein